MATIIVPVRIEDPKNKTNMSGCSNPEKISEIFKKYGYIWWMHKSGCPEYQKGDIAYMYICDPCKKIRFKVYIEDAKVQAAAEELRDYTWLKPEDREKQIQNNCNDKFVLIEEMDEGKRSHLALNKLRENGFEDCMYRRPTNITNKVDLIGYIESVING